MTKLCFRKIYIFFFLIFSLYGYKAFAEIDGKGLICKCVKNTKVGCLEYKPYQGITPYIGIFFSNKNVKVYSLYRSHNDGKSNLYISSYKEAKYYLEPSFVEWPRPNGVTQIYSQGYFFDKGKTLLNRKTLMLINSYMWGDFANNRTTTDEIVYDCNSTDLYKNPIIGIKTFEKKMDIFRQEGQKIENKLKKGNKF